MFEVPSRATGSGPPKVGVLALGAGRDGCSRQNSESSAFVFERMPAHRARRGQPVRVDFLQRALGALRQKLRMGRHSNSRVGHARNYAMIGPMGGVAAAATKCSKMPPCLPQCPLDRRSVQNYPRITPRSVFEYFHWVGWQNSANLCQLGERIGGEKCSSSVRMIRRGLRRPFQESVLGAGSRLKEEVVGRNGRGPCWPGIGRRSVVVGQSVIGR